KHCPLERDFDQIQQTLAGGRCIFLRLLRSTLYNACGATTVFDGKRIAMTTQQVRVLVADDHDVVRTGVRAILQAREDWYVCGDATNGKDAVRIAAELRPDIALVDLELEDLDGVAVTRQIKEQSPETEVLIFTMHDSEYLIREALSAGARGFLLKSEGGQ